MLNSVQKHGEQGWQGWGLSQEGSSFSIFKVETQLSPEVFTIYVTQKAKMCKKKSHLS